ncbi:GNAT family N-acetyltransferase [Halorubrum gandharaense]
MYVRDAKNRDEAWLLDEIEGMGLDAAAFRSRDYVIAVDEDSGTRAGFGRLRIHKLPDSDDEVVELTGIGVLPEWRGQGVGAHVVERLVDTAAAEGFETVYVLTDAADFLTQFGFEPVDEDELPAPLRERLDQKREEVDEDAVALAIGIDEFEMADHLREAFKHAAAGGGGEEDSEEATPEDTAEDFGIDPDSATYKYDTGK